ncbi:hypothetical protein S245_004396, partial [Arachis hypogaea]
NAEKTEENSNAAWRKHRSSHLSSPFLNVQPPPLLQLQCNVALVRRRSASFLAKLLRLFFGQPSFELLSPLFSPLCSVFEPLFSLCSAAFQPPFRHCLPPFSHLRRDLKLIPFPYGSIHASKEILPPCLDLLSEVGPVTIKDTSASGRACRDAAARAMRGWHSQRLLGNGEVGDAIIKDRNSVSMQKREKEQLKSISMALHPIATIPNRIPMLGTLVHSLTCLPVLIYVTGRDTAVIDIGPPADWVKINVQKT